MFIGTPTSTPPHPIPALRRTAEEALRDNNVRVQLIRPDAPVKGGARLAEVLTTNRLPAAVLVSPDSPPLAATQRAAPRASEWTSGG